MVAVFVAAGIALVEVDNHIDLAGVEYVFKGDASAARTVLSVIAGSLITVAGLTFSITMVVLQLASSQFSPRILRTFFGDRITQITIGFYVGTFVYALLVLREVGSFGDGSFVPRLSVTLASLLGMIAVGLLIVYLNHVAQMVQVSHVMADIAHKTLKQTDALFPEGFGAAETEDADALRARWRREPSGVVRPQRPGYVQRIALDELAKAIAGRVDHAIVRVCPGDFAAVDTALVEVWPADAAEPCRAAIAGAVFVDSERDIDQDVDFGLRQLADTALRAMSPGINDPATAVTCIGYLRSILTRLVAREQPPALRHFPDHGVDAAGPPPLLRGVPRVAAAARPLRRAGRLGGRRAAGRPAGLRRRRARVRRRRPSRGDRRGRPRGRPARARRGDRRARPPAADRARGVAAGRKQLAGSGRPRGPQR